MKDLKDEFTFGQESCPVYKKKEEEKNQKKKPAIFLDRDGVILPTSRDGRSYFVNSVKDLLYYEAAFEGMLEFTKRGYSLFVISNQGGVSLGKMSSETLQAINEEILNTVQTQGINLQGIYCCIHTPSYDCIYRKPNPGLVQAILRDFAIDMKASYLVGDVTSDILCGEQVGVQTILVKTGFAGNDRKYEVRPTFVAEDLLKAPLLVHSLKQ